MRAEARGLSGMLMASTPTDFQKARAFDFLADVRALGRNNLHHGHEFAGGKLRAQLRPLLQWHGGAALDRSLARTT